MCPLQTTRLDSLHLLWAEQGGTGQPRISKEHAFNLLTLGLGTSR